MSERVDIRRDLKDFLGSVDDLLNTETAKEAPNIARDLGAEPQLNGALDLVGKGLTRIEDGLELLVPTLIQVDGVVAGFEVIAAFIKDFSKGEAFIEVSKLLGVSEHENSKQPFELVSTGIQKVGDCLEAVLGLADILLAPQDVRSTRDQLKKLQESVTALKAS
jgi:hypothetical protein